MKKTTLVTLSAFVIAGLGILSFVIMPGRRPLFGGNLGYTLAGFLAPMDLSFFREGRLVNLLFYILLIVGGAMYTGNNKQVALLRFIFSILLMSNFAGILAGLLRIAFPLPEFFRAKPNIPLMIFAYLLNIGYIVLSYYLLSLLKQDRVLVKKPVEGTNPPVLEHVEVSTGLRFLHLLIDYLICVLIFSKLTNVFSYGGYIERMAHMVGMYGALSLFVLVFRIGYYILFESIFEATPAKFLTGSRTTSEKGQRANFINIIGRSFCRFVPFNNLSFLFRGNWHDSWSNTRVYKEAVADTQR